MLIYTEIVASHLAWVVSHDVDLEKEGYPSLNRKARPILLLLQQDFSMTGRTIPFFTKTSVIR